MNAQEIRADGWQRDYGKLTRRVSELAAELQRYRRRDTALRALVISWRDKAAEMGMHQVAAELRKCAGEVDELMREAD